MSNIFMHISGIQGSVTAPNYQGWIELEGFDFAVDRQVKTVVGRVVDRETALPGFSSVTLTKALDNASNDLFVKACGGKAIPQVEIHICATGKELTPYAKYVLSDVIIAKHRTSASAEVVPQEHVDLSYVKIERTFIPRDKQNKLQSPNTVGYDLTNARLI